MTVPSSVNRSGPYSGNGVATVFDYDFKIVSSTHLTVVRTIDGVDSIVSTSDYAVTGVGADNGTIVFTLAPATGQSITVIRNVPFTQETDLENQGAYYAETVESALDLSVMRDQQLEERLDRTVQIPVGADPSTLPTLVENIIRLSGSADNIDIVAENIDAVNELAPYAQTIAENVDDITNFSDVYLGPKVADPSLRNDGSALQNGDLYFNTTTNQLKVYDGSGWQSVTDQSLNVAFKQFTGDGSENDFTLDAHPASAFNVIASVGGALQTPIADYVTAGNILTFATAPGDGVKVNTWLLSTTSTLYAPADGTVKPSSFDTVLSFIFQTRANAIESAIPSYINGFITLGYSAAGDTGGAIYRRAASEPSHTGKIQTADGAWFELSTSQDVFAEMFGAVPNVTASQNTPVANAIAFAKAKGGLTINFGKGQFSFDTTVSVRSNNIKLRGRGAGDFHYVSPWMDYETAFIWRGASGGTMVNFNPTENGGMWLSGAGFDGIFLDGNGLAGTSLSVNSSFAGRYDVVSTGFSLRAMVLGVNSSDVLETKDSMHNEIWVRGSSLTGSLLVLAGAPDANSCFNRIKVDGNYKDNHGIQIYNADNNIFEHVRMYRETGGVGVGVVLNGGAFNEEARGNMFIDLSPGAGGVTALGTEGGAASASKENYCLFYDIQNFAPVPIIGTGATFFYATLDAKYPYSKVRIGNVTINSSTDTTLPISSVDADLTGMRSGNTFVCPKPGSYRVEYSIHYGSGVASGDKYILKVNGGKNGVYNTVFGTAGAVESSITGSVTIECDRGSVISLTLQRAAGSGSFVTGADTSLSSVTVSYVSRSF